MAMVSFPKILEWSVLHGGLFCDNRTCKCAHYHYPYDIIKCDEEKGSSALLNYYFATFNDSKNVTRVGACIIITVIIRVVMIMCTTPLHGITR